MVKIEWQYTCDQADPFIELECTEAELAEAREKLDDKQFIFWVGDVASGVSHAEAMEWVLDAYAAYEEQEQES